MIDQRPQSRPDTERNQAGGPGRDPVDTSLSELGLNALELPAAVSTGMATLEPKTQQDIMQMHGNGARFDTGTTITIEYPGSDK